MISTRKYSFFYFLILFLGLSLTGCKNSKNSDSNESDLHNAEDIEQQYDDTSDDFASDPEANATDNHQIEEIPAVQESNEMEIALNQMKKDVAILRDLLKKYRATGEEKYKIQSRTIANKALRVEEKIEKGTYHPDNAQHTEAFLLFDEFRNALNELQ